MASSCNARRRMRSPAESMGTTAQNVSAVATRGRTERAIDFKPLSRSGAGDAGIQGPPRDRVRNLPGTPHLLDCARQIFNAGAMGWDSAKHQHRRGEMAIYDAGSRYLWHEQSAQGMNAIRDGINLTCTHPLNAVLPSHRGAKLRLLKLSFKCMCTALPV